MADRWDTFNLGNVVPAFVPTVVGPAASAAKGIGQLLQTSVGLMSTLQTFIVDVTDPIAAITQALIAQIERELADFINTGIYFTCMVPKDLTDRKGTITNMRYIINSFYDMRDPARPQYIASQNVGAVVLLAGGADFTSLMPTAGLLDLLFNINEIKGFLRLNNPSYIPEAVPFPNGGGIVTGLVDGQDPRSMFTDLSRPERVDRFARLRMSWDAGANQGVTTRVRGFDPLTRTFEVVRCPRNIEVGDTYQILYPQGGRPPDWISVRAVDMVPPLSTVLITLQSMTRLLSAGVAASHAAADFVGALQKKAKLLVKIAQQIESQLARLQTLLQGSGLSILRLPPQPGGMDGLATRLLAAQNAPLFVDGQHFTVSAILVGNELSYQALGRLF